MEGLSDALVQEKNDLFKYHQEKVFTDFHAICTLMSKLYQRNVFAIASPLSYLHIDLIRSFFFKKSILCTYYNSIVVKNWIICITNWSECTSIYYAYKSTTTVFSSLKYRYLIIVYLLLKIRVSGEKKSILIKFFHQ